MNEKKSSCLKLGLSVVAIFLIFIGSATVMDSFRGEAGFWVASLVLLTCLIAQRFFGSSSILIATHSIGLGRPTSLSLRIACALSVLLLLVVPMFSALTNSQVTFYPGWFLLIPGLFAQGGVAEETLFRGYLFGNLRQRYSFWQAALIATGPFVAAHLFLFTTMRWPIALMATLLAFVISFPLAHLYELGARTIWAPALVHFTIQGTAKIIQIPNSSFNYQIVWLVTCAVVPWLVFAFRTRIKKSVALLALIMFCGLSAAHAQSTQTKSWMVGTELDVVPYLSDGYYVSAIIGVGRWRARYVYTELITPEFATPSGFENNALKVDAYIVDYYFKDGFKGWWVGPGYEIWDGKVKEKNTGVEKKYLTKIMTLGGGYTFRWNNHLYINPWAALHIPVGGDRKVLFPTDTFNIRATPEASVKIGFNF